MACLTLSSGRALPCRKGSGGLKSVYFADFGTLGTVTKSGSEITALESGDFYKFDINGSSSLETTINASKDNQSLFYTQTLSLNLLVLDKATQEQIKILAASKSHVAVEDQNGVFYMIGLINGAEANGGAISLGAAMGDAQSFSITLEAMEVDPAYFVEKTVIPAKTSATQINPNA
jgi:hypothetical protein